MDAFVVVSMSSWVADDFEPGITNQKLIRNWGMDIPEHLDSYDSVSWWMPAAHAARLQRVGHAMELVAPGPYWLTQAPESLTQRRVSASTVEEFLAMEPANEFFIKPAEAKIEGFEAAWRNSSQTREIISKLKIPSGTFLQWSDKLIDINHEYRFFVLDGQLTTGSSYLVGGITHYDGADNSKLDEAAEFAQYAVSAIDNQPSAYVIDVGIDVTTNSWLVIEGNPAWCSGIYGSDPQKVIRVIERACHAIQDDKNYLWTPDSFLKGKAAFKVPLK
jgi:hypothetical protein